MNYFLLLLFELTFLKMNLVFLTFLDMFKKSILSAVLFLAYFTFKKNLVPIGIFPMKDLMICQVALCCELFAAKGAIIISLVQLNIK